MNNPDFGQWPSPLSATYLAGASRLGEVAFDTKDSVLVWTESRDGRSILMVADELGNAPRPVTQLHSPKAKLGYGGGDFTVHDGHVFFVDDKSGALMRMPLQGGAARAITPKQGWCAAPAVSPDGRWVLFVHHADDGQDRLAVCDAEGLSWPKIVASGHDFYMQPRFSPDGLHAAWIAWDHPNMPWDGTSAYVAAVAKSTGGDFFLEKSWQFAGSPEIAVFQPEFGSDGRSIYFVADDSGWGELKACDLSSKKIRAITTAKADHGEPAWLQGMRTYALTRDGTSAYIVQTANGEGRLVKVTLATGVVAAVAALSGYSDVNYVSTLSSNGTVALRASAPGLARRVVTWNPQTDEVRILARSLSEEVPAAQFAHPEAWRWQSSGGEEVHGLLYRPHSDGRQSAGKAPLIVLAHGGPTTQVRAGWNQEAQYFATRGYAVLAVNYRGSTGYGREYMLKLRGAWGVVDVADCASGALSLAQAGLVDRSRMVIMGGSAGGYTVLRALTEQPDVFSAGICLYGLANLFVTETHKFESHYNDRLIGILPEAKETFRERSPLFAADRIRSPVAVFQGEDDVIVPKAHSDQIVAALVKNRVPHVYHVYKGEGHGWRKRETIEHYYQTVEAFLLEHLLYR